MREPVIDRDLIAQLLEDLLERLSLPLPSYLLSFRTKSGREITAIEVEAQIAALRAPSPGNESHALTPLQDIYLVATQCLPNAEGHARRLLDAIALLARQGLPTGVSVGHASDGITELPAAVTVAPAPLEDWPPIVLDNNFWNEFWKRPDAQQLYARALRESVARAAQDDAS